MAYFIDLFSPETYEAFALSPRVDRLDAKTDPQQIATNPQQYPEVPAADSPEVIDKIGGGGWTRTNDLGIMRPSL
jgi:hypothetical protein